MFSDRDLYEFDPDIHCCPYCSRSLDTCDCTDADIEDFYYEQERDFDANEEQERHDFTGKTND